MQQPNLASRVFGIRLHAPAGHDPSPMHFPLGSLAESPRYPERAPIIVGPCPYKLPGHIPPFGSPRTRAPRVDAFSVVGPNIRAQPVVSITRSLGFASSGHPHTLLMRDSHGSRSQLAALTISPRVRAERGAAALSERTPRTPFRLPPLSAAE